VTSGVFLDNLLCWTLQAGAVVGAGAAFQWLLRAEDPRGRLWFGQALLAVCLLLPLVQPWRSPLVVVPEVTPQPVAVEVAPPPPPAPRTGGGATVSPLQSPPAMVQEIDVSALPESLQGMVREKLTPFQGRHYSREVNQEIASLLKDLDRHLIVMPLAQSPPTAPGADYPLRLFVRLLDEPQGIPAQPSPPATPGVQRIRVGEGVQASGLLFKVEPEYPPMARAARISGVVRFNVVIGADGRIQHMTLVSGHPLLVPAAQEAVRQYRYRPVLLNGQPVEVVTVVEVPFAMP